jgi:hypothetical protein
VSNQVKRERPGGVFTYDKEGKLASLNFLKALELSSTMAVEFLATWAMQARVVAATVAKDRGTECPAPIDWPLVMLKQRLGRLPTAAELADSFRVEELVEMQGNLAAGLVRHIQAYNCGYGDALRSERLKAQARDIHRMTRGQKVLTERHIKGKDVPPNEEIEWSENKINSLIASLLSLGNESSSRLLLKPRSTKARFYLEEIEPRRCERKVRSAPPEAFPSGGKEPQT